MLKNFITTIFALLFLTINSYAPCIGPFFEAINRGNYQKVKDFLEQGMDPNSKYYEMPAIMAAIYTGNINIVYWLLICGADPNSFDNQFIYKKLNPISCAINQRMYGILELLLQYKADPIGKKFSTDEQAVLKEEILNADAETMRILKTYRPDDNIPKFINDAEFEEKWNAAELWTEHFDTEPKTRASSWVAEFW